MGVGAPFHITPTAPIMVPQAPSMPPSYSPAPAIVAPAPPPPPPPAVAAPAQPPCKWHYEYESVLDNSTNPAQFRTEKKLVCDP